MNKQQDQNKQDQQTDVSLQNMRRLLNMCNHKLKANTDEIEQLKLRIQILEQNQPDFEIKSKQIKQQKTNDFESIIKKARDQEQEMIDLDQQKIELGKAIISHWIDKGNCLKLEIEKNDKGIMCFIEESRNIFNTLPDELKQTLQKYQDGLEIIGRMWMRAVNTVNLNILTDQSVFSEQIKASLTYVEWKQLIENAKNKEDALHIIKRKLNVLGRNSYQIVSKINKLASKQQKNFFDYMNTSILPIIDGITAGKKQSQKAIESLKQKHDKHLSKLNQWLDTYLQLRLKLNSCLEKSEIRQMDIQIGQDVDYNCHEPTGTSPDKKLKNEQIKEVTLEGFEVSTHDNQFTILRNARVIVVKNILEDSEENDAQS